MNMLKKGFTIIEMLVVISIIALLSSMIIIIPNHEDSASQIDMAASLVAGTFKTARKLALETKNTYAVVIHIQNSGDGSVLKNFSQTYEGADQGRHWIAVIGPDEGFLSKSENEPPMAYQYPHLEAFTRTMEIEMVEKTYLPRGTRFLAISDLEDGNTSSSFSNGDHGETFPRPWFGVFKGGKLYPWGAYNPEIDVKYRDSHSSVNGCTTGILYEGADGPIPYNKDLDANVNPNPTFGRLFSHVNKIGAGSSGTADTGQDPEHTLVGKPRPLLSGLGMDYAFLFSGNGRCSVYKKTRYKIYDNTASWNPRKWRCTFDLKHSSTKTGGFYITVARDVDPNDKIYSEINSITNQFDYSRFQNVEDAFASITPFRRVFIHKKTGSITVRNSYHEDAYLEPEHLLQHDPYPTKNITFE